MTEARHSEDTRQPRNAELVAFDRIAMMIGAQLPWYPSYIGFQTGIVAMADLSFSKSIYDS